MVTLDLTSLQNNVASGLKYARQHILKALPPRLALSRPNSFHLYKDKKFEPKAIRKYENDCNEFDKKIIELYTRGMSTRDIQSELEELYGIDVSPDMISKITDKVILHNFYDILIFSATFIVFLTELSIYLIL